jgi:hypothetical protein
LSIPLLYEKSFHVILIRKCWWNSQEQRCLQQCTRLKCPLTGCPQCHPVERPVCKKPVFPMWPENPASLLEARKWTRTGGNLAVVGGRMSGHDGWNLGIADYDTRSITGDGFASFYRAFRTFCVLSPRGFHLYFYHRKRMTIPELLRRTGWPKPDTVRGDAQYVLVPPSRVRGKFYWWLDSGRTEIRRVT